MDTMIIELVKTGDGFHVRLEKPPSMIDDGSTFSCTLTDPALEKLVKGEAGDDVVANAGALLWDALVANDRVGNTLSAAVSNRTAATIGVRFGAGPPERFPWEVLRGPEGFVALADWPVARFPNVDYPPAEYVVDPPIRLLVILGARGITGAKEWEGIRAAVDATDVPIEVSVFTSQPELAATIDAAKHPKVRSAGLTNSDKALADHVGAFPPHLVHIFCHGVTGGSASDVGYLQIATPASWPEGGPHDHIYLSDGVLRRWFEQHKPWLTTLSCCEGGAPGEGAASLAFALAFSGLPAVVAMRRPITQAVATTFTASHYREIFDVLANAVATGEPMRWASATAAVRLALCGLHPGPPTAVAEAHDEWSLPVLYLAHPQVSVRAADTFRFVVNGLVQYNPELRSDQIGYWQGTLAELRRMRREFESRRDTTPAILAGIDQRIDETVATLFAEGTPP